MKVVGPIRYYGPPPEDAWRESRDYRYLDCSVAACCAGAAKSNDLRDCTCEHEWRDIRQLAEAGVQVAYRFDKQGDLVVERPEDTWASPRLRGLLLARSMVVMR